jgi:hypothetical protein
MDGSRIFPSRFVRLALIGILGACCGCGGSSHHEQNGSGGQATQPAATQANAPISANDVSWLFPAPTRAEDFAKLIAISDLTTPDSNDATKRNAVWPDAVFQNFLAIAASPAAQVAGAQSQIGLPAEAQSKANWFIAGVRIDAGAPGLSSDIRGQFGQRPEIRLILQPVTRKPDGTPKVDDIAAHLIFDFTLPKPDDPPQAGCLARPQPDLDAFNSIVTDLVALRTKLNNGQLGTNKVATSGVPLGVHPGLVDATTASNVRQEMISFLEKHLSNQRLDAMAIAGLPTGAPAPWIFLSMVEVPPGAVPALPNGGFIPVHSPTLDGQQFAEMLQPVNKLPRVVPDPHTNNLNPITCENAANPGGFPIAGRNGVATASIFGAVPPLPNKATEVLDVIADPTKSHFFNTDCVSCHTETRRSMEILGVKAIPGIDPAVLPNGPWDVRNFGWSSAPQATATRRTAVETAAVVTFINSEILAKRVASNH